MKVGMDIFESLDSFKNIVHTDKKKANSVNDDEQTQKS